jgi:hypothetical protein
VRGAECDFAGVGKAGSGGRFEVKTLDLGRDCRVYEPAGLDDPFAPLEPCRESSRCAMIWLRRIELATDRLELRFVSLRAAESRESISQRAVEKSEHTKYQEKEGLVVTPCSTIYVQKGGKVCKNDALTSGRVMPRDDAKLILSIRRVVPDSR